MRREYLRSRLQLITLAVAFSSAIYAAQMAVSFDPAKTTINWTLVGNVHTVHGTFKLKQGRISFDPTNGAISGELIADATSGESANGARDKRMHKEILESARYPAITFAPKRVDAALPVSGRAKFRLTGVFTIHGTSHEITIPLEATIAGSEVTGKGEFVVPFVDWGMKDPSNFLFKVDKTVTVEVVAVGRVAAAE